ncbi:MAG: FAD:protein FMN transferase, partial [Burkholderiaceae bacterium]
MFGFSIDSITRNFDQGGSLSKPKSNGGWLKREEAIMGTAISVELWSDDQVAGEAAIAAVMEEMHRIDRTMSPHKPDSELSRINRDAASAPVTISSEMTRLLARAAHFSRLSGGAFDITYAAVGRLFDYRQGIRPTPAALEKARLAVGYQNVQLDEKSQTVRFARPDVCLDLGGFAKGHAIDNATAILRQRGIVHANISAGGDSRVMSDRRGRPWMIGIRDPRRDGEVVAVLPLEDTSISTSGDYERYFVEDGVRFHHLIDPATGKSPNGIRSATILAEDGLTTEALSKS